MNRRQLLAGVGVLFTAPIVGRVLYGRAVYGPLTINRHAELKGKGVHLRVLYRGEDVTERCTFADDTPGHERAELLKRDQFGVFYRDEETDKIARETVTGADVRIVEAA